jgi:hypothetical protein
VLRGIVGPIVLAASVGLASPSVGVAQSKYGLLRASPTLSDRIELDSTHGVAGARLRGTLVVTNRGPRPVNLTRRCYPGFLIELTNNQIAPQVSFGSPCVNRALLIHPGTRRFTMTILTTEACLAAGGASATPIPTCSPTGGLPALPPGRVGG